MAHLETQWRVIVEFLRASQSGRGRIIRLNHSPGALPPQLAGRLHPGFWQAFMEDAGQLSLQHPFTAKPTTKDYCNWAACFGLGAVVGLFCINPDAGNYGVWESQCRQFCDRWAPGFAQAGCALTLQRHRDYFLQASIDINPNIPPQQQPVSPPLPQYSAPPPGAGGPPAAVGVPLGQYGQQQQDGAFPLPPPKQV
ncbi:hypothetical protein ABPG77_000014 [Micractinium sp. CCAP 211/92]